MYQDKRLDSYVGYMLDSNVFDYILVNRISAADVCSLGEIYITNVQISEIANITDHDKKRQLQRLIDDIAPTKLLLKSGVWIDELHWDDDQPWIDEVNEDCSRMIGNATSNPPWRDALIAEVTKNQNIILITNDAKFLKRAIKHGISAAHAQDVFGRLVAN